MENKIKKLPFWKVKKLDEMSQGEWESLCDRCGKCCLEKAYCDDSNTTYTLSITCRLMDINTGLCSSYNDRKKFVPECIKINSKNISNYNWIPRTCAYRLIHEGRDLPEWHPLITGDYNSVIISGNSVVNFAVHPIECKIKDEDINNYIIDNDKSMPPVSGK